MLIDENGNPVSVGENDSENGTIPAVIEMYPAYPNPFNPITKIKYEVTEPMNVNIIVYDILGQKVSELINEEKPGGEYEVIIDAEHLKLSSGTYIVVLKTKEQQFAQKINFIK
jgi:hypothetical protein